MKNLNKDIVLIVLGPPGSGKGAQGTLLAEKLGLYHFETSKILEKSFRENKEGEYLEAEGEKYFYSNEKKLWEEGTLNSPPYVVELVKERVRTLHSEEKGLLFSGSPRTVYEGERIIPLLSDLYGKENIFVVVLDIKPETTIFRNSNRKICKLMRHSIIFNEETEKLTKCPLDGSELVRRKGLDDEETIKIRIEEYKERTKPLIDFIKKEGLNVKEVNGEAMVDEVYQSILKALEIE
jgi:adenylate kinase